MQRTQRKNSLKIKTTANIISKTIATRRNIGVTKMSQNQHHKQPTKPELMAKLPKKEGKEINIALNRGEKANNSSKINEPDLHRNLHNTWGK